MPDHKDSKADSRPKGQNDWLEKDQPSAVKTEQQVPENSKPTQISSKKSKCSKSQHSSPAKKKTTNSRGNANTRKPPTRDNTSDDEEGTGAHHRSESDAAGPSSDAASSTSDAKPKVHRGVRKSKAQREKETFKRCSKNRSDETSNGESDGGSWSEDEGSDSEPSRKKKNTPTKKKSKPTVQVSDDSSSESSDSEPSTKKTKKVSGKKSRKFAKQDTDDSSTDKTPKRKKKQTKKAKKVEKSKKSKKYKKVVQSDTEMQEGTSDDDSVDTLTEQLEKLKAKLADKQAGRKKRSKPPRSPKGGDKKEEKKSKTLGYSRVDQVWDSVSFRYQLKESVKDDHSAFDDYAFLVRRRFDPENKYRDTTIDIKAVALRTVLQEILKDCKHISLETDEPAVDPNTLFLYLEELRTHYRKTLTTRIEAEKKKKVVKELKLQRSLCRTLVEYLDGDYAQIKKTLFPLLEAGNITYELLWALFKPSDIAITSSYGVSGEPRCFKVEVVNKYSTMTRDFYAIDGKYLEYDGKNFGMGDFEAELDTFKGPRKITSLGAYPLRYHKDPEGVKKQIIERGRKFVSLEGMNYRFHKGMAFHKKKKQVLKININGRVMVDPATFRRINPNYAISLIKSHEGDGLISEEEQDSDCGCSSSDEDEEKDVTTEQLEQIPFESDKPKTKLKPVENKDGDIEYHPVEVDDNGDPIRPNKVEELEISDDPTKRDFTDDQLLLATSVVYGFAFSEKLWLEFTVSGIVEITYNEEAFDSLVLPSNQKSIVKALVESHKFHAAKTIDDVVQGKGKGLVSVLHGPPGTGKTLTAEGISELLRCPLYMVSAGELGTDPAKLEYELQKILDIAHSWGAVLLLDEADVFLEKREVHDIHRNALVSIFLRLLEYFQGILFLTTNRVETFDDAFQSRIHVALRYGELSPKARKTVWKQFVAMVGKQSGCEVGEIGEKEFEGLSRHTLNGRQVSLSLCLSLAPSIRVLLNVKMLTLCWLVDQKRRPHCSGSRSQRESAAYYSAYHACVGCAGEFRS